MTVQIGTTQWDRHAGALTPPGPAVQIERRADGSVRLHEQAQLDEATGTITTTRSMRSERDAYRLNALASQLIDQRVSIGLPGVVFAGVRVDGVNVEITKTRYRAGEEWLVRATWTFGPRSDDGDVSQLYVPTRVETATVWGQWTARPELVCTAAADVLSGAGSAAFLQSIDPDIGDQLPLDILDHYVRVWLPSGGDLRRPTSFALAWHGRIKQRDVSINAGRVLAHYAAADLSGEFDTCLVRWYERRNDGTGTATSVDPGEILPFNGAQDGDRSNTDDRIGPFDTWGHERTQVGNRWRGTNIVDTLLAALRSQFPGGPVWALGGQRTALENFPSASFDGRSVREQIAQIIGHGLAYRITYDGGDQPTIAVRSPLPAPITAAGWTYPANDAPVTVDLQAMTDLTGWSYGEDASRQADDILLELSRRWDAATFGIVADNTGQLRKDYTAFDETQWEAATVNARNTRWAHVHRRFRLAPNWLGGTYKQPAETLPLVRAVATSDVHGEAGETGEFQAGDAAFSAHAVRFSKVLPFAAGKNWSGVSPQSTTINPAEPLERAFVCVVTDPGAGGESWALLDMEVTIDGTAPVITLGRDATDAATIKAALAAGKHLVVTLGYNYPLPWRVSWRRPSAEVRTDRRRSVVYQRPDIEWRYMREDTVTGITGTAPVLADGGTIGTRSEAPLQYLAILRQIHERPSADLSWSRAAIDLSAAAEPGSLVTAATLPYGDGGHAVAPVALIASRAYNLDRERPSTTVSCARRPVDVPWSPDPERLPPNFTANELAALAYGR